MVFSLPQFRVHLFFLLYASWFSLFLFFPSYFEPNSHPLCPQLQVVADLENPQLWMPEPQYKVQPRKNLGWEEKEENEKNVSSSRILPGTSHTIWKWSGRVCLAKREPIQAKEGRRNEMCKLDSHISHAMMRCWTKSNFKFQKVYWLISLEFVS